MVNLCETASGTSAQVRVNGMRGHRNERPVAADKWMYCVTPGPTSVTRMAHNLSFEKSGFKVKILLEDATLVHNCGAKL